MSVHITLLKPGKKYGYPENDVLIELSSTNCDSLEADRQYWQKAGESPDLVVGHLVLNLPEEAEDYLEELRERDGPDILEHILTATFNLGRAFQR